MRSLRRSPAKHIDLLPQDQVFRFQRCSRLEARSQDTENQLEQIGHQDASLRRPPAPSTPNRIFGTHTCLRLRTLRISVLTAAATVPNWAAFWTRWATRALQSSFLDGRQATAGHEPPTQRRSTTATFLPEWPRCHASSFPPWPLPRITTSKSSVWNIAILLPPLHR